MEPQTAPVQTGDGQQNQNNSQASAPAAEPHKETTQSQTSSSGDTRDEVRELKVLLARQSEELGQLRGEIKNRVLPESGPSYTQAPIAPKYSTTTPKYEEMFYNDVNQPFQIAEERAVQRGFEKAMNAVNQRLAEKEFEDRFYAQNRDLDSTEGKTIASMIATRYSEDLRLLPINERAPYLAQKSREFIRGLTKSSGTSRAEILSDKAPIVEGGGTVPTAPAPAQTTRPSFVDQLKNHSQLDFKKRIR